MTLVDDSYDVREVLSRSRDLLLALAHENDELGQLIGEVRQLLDGLEPGLAAGGAEGESDVELRERVTAQRAELSELRARLAVHEDRRLQDRRRLLERQHQALMMLYVATHRLLEAQEPEEVYEVIFEVVANLIGCEEVAIYHLVERDGASILTAGSTLGLQPERIAARVVVGEGLIGEAAARGERVIPSSSTATASPAHERGISACVPLLFAERTEAVLVLYGLLDHKPEGLTDLDHRVLDMLMNQAGLALRVAAMRANELESTGLI